MQADVMIYVRIGNIKEGVCQLIRISDVLKLAVFGKLDQSISFGVCNEIR